MTVHPIPVEHESLGGARLVTEKSWCASCKCGRAYAGKDREAAEWRRDQHIRVTEIRADLEDLKGKVDG